MRMRFKVNVFFNLIHIKFRKDKSDLTVITRIAEVSSQEKHP